PGGERVAVGVGVIGQHPGGGHGQGRVLVGAVAVVGRHGGVVDRGDGEADGGDVAVGRAVVGLVGEAVRAVVVGRRRVREAAVAAQGQRAVAGAADQDGRERVAVHIGIVGQNAG